MVEDICFHVTDLVQNAVAAGAGNIHIVIRESSRDNLLSLEVSDDGQGMDAETVERVQDPFFTTKPFKKVGLGIPLLKATAQACGGDFAISSRPGQGTRIHARFEKNHLDCPPLGSLDDTMLTLLVTLDSLNLDFCYENDRGRFAISSADIRRQVGDIPLSHPEVFAFLRQFVNENLATLNSPAD